MNNSGYVVLSRQAGLSKELNSIANNIANADTTGFRREGYLFSEYIRALDPQDRSLSQTNAAGRFIDMRPGAVSQTGSKFDVAIDGEGFFVVETPHGERLTRSGAFTLNSSGEMATPEGYRILGEGSAPIAVPPEAADITIAPDGSVAADGQLIGKITIVSTEHTALVREGDNLFHTTQDYTPVEQPLLRQGFIEDSNVNPVIELSRLIEVQRAYELNQQLLSDEDDRISRVIDTTGQR